MKACVLHAVNNLQYEEVATPEPKPDEVLLKIRASGICGSDIARVFEKGTYHFPTIPGHEFAGEIISVGSDELKNLIGKRAAVFPMLPCMQCASCQIGQYAQCADYDYYGSRRDGGFAEYLCVKAWNLVMIPDEISFEEAAMCEPCAVGIHAISQAGVSFGDVVTIFGCGTIGLMLAKIASAYGAREVILVDVDDRKLAFANKAGFKNTINSMKEDAPAKVMEITGGRGSELVIEGSGVGAALEGCLKSAAPFGRIVLMGNPAKDMHIGQKAYWEILRKQLKLFGTWNSSYNGMQNDWKNAIESMKKLNLKELITHRFEFSQCNEAFNLMKDQSDFLLKVMFIND